MGFSWVLGRPVQRARPADVSTPLSRRTRFDGKMMRNEEQCGCEEPFSGLRHTSTKRAMKHAVKAALVKQLGRIKQVSLFLFGE
jgi:hypothetical protein